MGKKSKLIDGEQNSMFSRFARLIFAVLTACLLAGCGEPDSSFDMPEMRHATLLSEPRPVADFRLTDQSGTTFSALDLRGRWNVLFTGFTHCPDICPATLGLLSAVERRLEGEPGYRVIFVSVDPERDTPDQLREYMVWFSPEWTGLTGPKSELDRLLGSLQMAYVRVPTGDGEYTMDHATALLLIDPEGRMAGFWKAPLDLEALSEDLAGLSTL